MDKYDGLVMGLGIGTIVALSSFLTWDLAKKYYSPKSAYFIDFNNDGRKDILLKTQNGVTYQFLQLDGGIFKKLEGAQMYDNESIAAKLRAIKE